MTESISRESFNEALETIQRIRSKYVPQEGQDYYNHPDNVVKGAMHRDLSLSAPLNLTEREVTDIEAFLVALTDDQFMKTKN